MSKKLDTAVQIGAEFSNQKKLFFSRKISNRRPNFWETTFIYQRRESSSAVKWRNLQPPRTQKRIPDYEFLTQSDCEVILALYKKNTAKILSKNSTGFCIFTL